MESAVRVNRAARISSDHPSGVSTVSPKRITHYSGREENLQAAFFIDLALILLPQFLKRSFLCDVFTKAIRGEAGKTGPCREKRVCEGAGNDTKV